MARALLTQASLGVAEKRVEECIHCICEALVRHLMQLILSPGVLLCTYAQDHPMDLDTWEECMLLLLTVASCSSPHCESCVTVVCDAVSSVGSVLNRNCNEKNRVETTQAKLRARYTHIYNVEEVNRCLYVLDWQLSRLEYC